ncbi:MAG TPA: sugar phosphate isomerase/epimerase, partial [Armatimonadetes bacterium]|nr:sugar phosphate isomerase/epimerase [Armatimonadota bacterium]
MAIKLSFMTWVCPDWDVQQIVGAAKQYRYHGIEFRTEANQRHGIEPEADATFIRDVRQMFADNGLEISAIATSCRFSSADATERGHMVERAKQHIDLAAQIGSANVRVFGGAIPKGVSMDDAKRYIADCLRQLGEYAQPLGVYVLLETHDAFSRSKDALETVRIADHQHVR